MIWMLFRLNIAGVAAETVSYIERLNVLPSARLLGLADLGKLKN